KAGANGSLFDQNPGDEFAPLLSHDNLTIHNRLPQASDFDDVIIAYGASEDPARDKFLAQTARQKKILVNVADVFEYCDFITPSVVDRSPLVVAISSSGTAPVIARIMRARIESLIPATYGRLAEFLGGFRQAVADKISSTVDRRHFWERVIDGPVGDLFLAGDQKNAEQRLLSSLEKVGKQESKANTGEVYLVGAGPGDPDLLTFRALRLMQRADVVLYDRLVSDDILTLVRRDAERINVGKRPKNHTMEQQDISQMLADLALKGKRVLRLKGGDPFIFGRGGEEIEKLGQHNIPFQVVPGITASIGAASYAGIPLTHRDHAQSCIFITAHGKDGVLNLDWDALLRPSQTVAIYMGLSNLQQLAKEFVAHGADPNVPAALIENATCSNQQVVIGTVKTLFDEATKAKVKGPSIIIIGDVVKLHSQLKWITPTQNDTHAMSLQAQKRL
ncbi:MAG: siroheme synthase CysG, partial [Devosiaceae bacterium]|nr:siroheme synthase CysG [Devosiaceae bacterium]